MSTLQVTSFSVSADVQNSSRVRRTVASVARKAGLPSSRVYDLKVAVSEAVANAIEHSCLPGDEVAVEVVWHTDRLEVQVHSPRPFCIDHEVSGSRRHGGLGLPLMASLADQLTVRRHPGGGATVALAFWLGSDSPLPA